MAPSASWVLAARFSDRIGKGIRGAPRDALIGDLVAPQLRGAAYGLRQSLDTVGAFVGPLAALALMAALVADAAPDDLRGTAFGLFNLASGVMLLLASLIAGILWDLVGPRATFIAGAAFTAIGLLGFVPLMRHAVLTSRAVS